MKTPNTSDTPRTDAAYADAPRADYGGMSQMTSIARTLERELNAANKKLDRIELWKEEHWEEKKQQWLNSVTLVCADFSNVDSYIKQQDEELNQLRTTNAALEKQVEELKVFIHEVGRGEHDSLLRRERDSLRAQLAECEKDKERLDWAEVRHLKIYRFMTGAKLKVWKDDDDTKEEYFVDTSNIRTAIDSAIAATNENKQ